MKSPINKRPPTFGQLVRDTSSTIEFLALEQNHKRDEQFRQLDAVVGRLLVRCLNGARAIELERDEHYVRRLHIRGLSDKERAFIDDWFAVERQETRGTWSLPDKANLKVGWATLGWAYQQWGRFGSSLSAEERGSVQLATTPDAVFYWSILEIFFNNLCLPFMMRGPLSGEQTREEQLEMWMIVDALYNELGFELKEELAVMRYGGGWHRLRSADQLRTKLHLLEALGRQANDQMGARYRASQVLSLITNYYKKAKSDGRIKRKHAVTKTLERALSGYWGGDWLGFLRYIGEEPHADEQIVVALPKIRLFVHEVSNGKELAAPQGPSIQEIKKIASVSWKQSAGVSLVEKRVELLCSYWDVFQAIHARQRSGMKALWGLVEDQRSVSFQKPLYDFNPELYRELLTPEMLSSIERLWGTIMFPQWPDRMVSETFPHALMADAFGVALNFWHGCALTAWFNCEGPWARVDISALENYYREAAVRLETLGTPLDPRMFKELIDANSSLGPVQPIYDETDTTEVMAGISISISFSTGRGSRKGGFDKLTEIITRYRHKWTEQYLQNYLRARWESEVRGAERAYHTLASVKGTPPTLKQFAKAATVPTNHWFGGDVSCLYEAIGQESPSQPQYCCIMPRDRAAFVRSVYYSLGGKEYEYGDYIETPEQQDVRVKLERPN